MIGGVAIFGVYFWKPRCKKAALKTSFNNTRVQQSVLFIFKQYVLYTTTGSNSRIVTFIALCRLRLANKQVVEVMLSKICKWTSEICKLNLCCRSFSRQASPKLLKCVFDHKFSHPTFLCLLPLWPCLIPLLLSTPRSLAKFRMASISWLKKYLPPTEMERNRLYNVALEAIRENYRELTKAHSRSDDFLLVIRWVQYSNLSKSLSNRCL